MSDLQDPVHARLVELVATYGAKVKALLRSYGLDRYGIDPADVEQDVRIRLWHAIDRDRSGAFHASYVQRVVASTVIDAMRRAEVRATEPLPEFDDDENFDVDAAPISPDRSAADTEKMQALARCMALIPERRRLPIALHLQGFSLQEIADMTDVASAEAARKLVSRGLAELREKLGQMGLGDFED